MSHEIITLRRPQDGPCRRGPRARPPVLPDRDAPRPASSNGSTSTTTGPRRRSTSSPGISVPEPHQIVIQPWDRSVLGAIERAITKSDIGLTPNVDGAVVRLNIPALTEERRHDLVTPGPQAHGGGPGRDPEPPARRRRPAQEAPEGRLGRRRRGAAPHGGHPEDHRPLRRRGRSRRREPRSRRSSRSSGACAADPPDGRPASGPTSRHRGAARGRRAAPSRRPASGPTFRGTSRSSWTATAAGPAPAASPRSTATPPASRRSASSCGTPSVAASRS